MEIDCDTFITKRTQEPEKKKYFLRLFLGWAACDCMITWLVVHPPQCANVMVFKHVINWFLGWAKPTNKTKTNVVGTKQLKIRDFARSTYDKELL